VFRNGALLDGYEQSAQWMLDWRPEVVLQGHQPAMFTDEHFFRHIAEWTNDYSGLARAVMPLEEIDIHFNLDSWGGWIWPYRVVRETLDAFQVRVTVRNPFPDKAQMEVRLVGPPSWYGETKTLPAEGREEVSSELSMIPGEPCYRQPIALELTVNRVPFGQVAEAIVTIR
jgi:hypothetical protein